VRCEECGRVTDEAATGWREGDTIPQGAAGNLRVVQILAPERDDQLPVLVAEIAQ